MDRAFDLEKQDIFANNLRDKEKAKRLHDAEIEKLTKEWDTQKIQLLAQYNDVMTYVEKLESELHETKEKIDRMQVEFDDAMSRTLSAHSDDIKRISALHAAEKAAIIKEFTDKCTALEASRDIALLALRNLEVEMENQMKEHEAYVQELMKEHSEEITNLIIANDKKMKALIAEYEAKLAALELELRGELAVALRKLKEADEKYKELLALIEEITGQKISAEDALSLERTAVSQLRAEIDRLKALLDNYANVEKEMSRLKSLIANLQNENAGCAKENSDLRALIRQLEQDILVKNNMIATQLARLDALKDIETENSRRGEIIRQLQATIADNEAEINSLREELKRIQEDAANRYAALRAEVERITGIKMSIEGDLNEEKSLTDRLRDEIDRLMRSIEELNRIAAENQAKQVYVLELENEIQRLHRIITELEQKKLSYTTEWRSGSPTRTSPRLSASLSQGRSL